MDPGQDAPTPVPFPLTFRPLVQEDLPALEALLAQVGLPADGLGEPPTTGILAWDGQILVGSALLERYGHVGLLRSVAVAPTWQGQGLGRHLVLTVLQEAGAAQTCRRVYLLTETAAPFFARLGFRRVARGQVDPAVQRSVEFAHACPASAQAMVWEPPGPGR